MLDKVFLMFDTRPLYIGFLQDIPIKKIIEIVKIIEASEVEIPIVRMDISVAVWDMEYFIAAHIDYGAHKANPNQLLAYILTRIGYYLNDKS